MLYLPQHISRVISALSSAGFEAYAVGGAVRDMLMSAAPRDYDVATSALPDETEAVFARERVLETGKKHGTVTLLTSDGGVEITTFRADGEYSDNRHPDAVRFVSGIDEDLARRDFTINAMAYDGKALRDPFGGRRDIAARTIRCVGEPERRFGEDSLRILRGLRLASELEFAIEPETAEAMRRCRALLQNVSAERINTELTRLLCGVGAQRVLLQYPDVLSAVLPEIEPMVGFLQHSPWHSLDVWAHTAAVVANAPAQPVLRWAALFHDMGKPATFSLDESGVGHFYGHASVSRDIAVDIMHRLRFDRASAERIELLVKRHDTPVRVEREALKKLLRRIGAEAARQLLQLGRADNLGQSEAVRHRQAAYDAAEALLEEILAADECFTLKKLAVNGSDALAVGLRGAQIGAALNELLDAVVEGRAQNDRAELLALLAHIAEGENN